jgi:hypothetical protein
MDHAAFHHQVFINKFSRVSIVGVYSTEFCSSQDPNVQFFYNKKITQGLLVRQVQLGMTVGDEVVRATRLQLTHDGRTNHARLPAM